MPFANGTFSLVSTVNPVVTGTTITSTWANSTLSDIASGLSTAVLKNGTQTVTANIPMSGFKFTGLGLGTAAQDSVRMSQLQGNTANYLSSVAGTNTVTASATPTVTAYTQGQQFVLIPEHTNTGALTLNINSAGAKNVYYSGAACVGGEFKIGVPTIIEYDGTQFNIIAIFTDALTTVTPDPTADYVQLYTATGYKKTLAGSIAGSAPSTATNFTITTTRGSNAETIALKTAAGSDPSATDPIRLAFRSATAGTGTYSVLTITSALSLTVSSGSTLGASSGVPFRLWLVCFNDGGTARLGIVNTQISDGIFYLQDDLLLSSTAEGGAGGADSAGVIYTGTAVTTKAFRVFGYLEYTLATAGTWDTAPSKVQLYEQGNKLPGDRVQLRRNLVTGVVTCNTTMPWDNSIPQNTEGDEVMTQAITPTSAINKLLVSVHGQFNASNNVTVSIALFQDATADALAAVSGRVGATNWPMDLLIGHYMRAATTSATTFKVRCGPDGGGPTSYMNAQNGGTGLFNGTANSYIEVTEILV